MFLQNRLIIRVENQAFTCTLVKGTNMKLQDKTGRKAITINLLKRGKYITSAARCNITEIVTQYI